MRATEPPVTPRRGFLGRLAATAVAVGLGGAAPARLSASPLLDDASSPDLEQWPGTVRGKHRQLFDAVSPNDGFAMVFAMVFLNANNEASRLHDDALNAVIVLRHLSAPLALTDPVWEKYKIGEAFGIKDPKTGAPAVRNPYFRPADGELRFPGMAIDQLQARGAIFGVCNVALTVLSGMRAQAAGVTADAAKAEWIAGVIPGITVLPAGVWGVNRAQEHGCTYCYAG